MDNIQNPIARQFALEAEAARLGAEKLRERTEADEQREYASGTVWGRSVINQQIKTIAAAIDAQKKRLTNGRAQAGATKVTDVLEVVEPEVLAAIAAKKAFDLIARGKDDKGNWKNTYTNVCQTIGAAIQAECRIRWYELKAPKQWKSVCKKFFHASTGTTHKERSSKTIMNKLGFRWANWSRAKEFQVGAFLLDCIMQNTVWFESVNTGNAGKNSYHIITLHSQMKGMRETLMVLAELQAPLTFPMLCEPADWSNDYIGGYLTSELRQGFSLVRGRKTGKGSTLILGKHPLEMLNTLQRVAYRINPVTFAVMSHLHEKGQTLTSFVMEDNEAPIPRPDTEDKDILKAWRFERSQQENRNAGLRGKRYRSMETYEVAERFAVEERFFVPWSFDYRGRVYPLISYLSPQGTDMEKSLYLFADEQPVTEGAKRWLAIHLANCAGEDKLPLDARVQWVEDNLPFIEAVALDPLNHLSVIEATDSPWCFIAAAHEYYHCVVTGEKKTTGLPVATDATCSGLQHLSAATLDAATAHLVNVSPTERPSDAYKAVLHRTVELLREPPADLIAYFTKKNKERSDKAEEEGKEPNHFDLTQLDDLADWAESIGRSLTKRVVMTVVYAATEEGNKGHIKEAVDKFEIAKEKRGEGERRHITSNELVIYVKFMRKAMAEVVPGPMAVMEWIKQSIANYYRDDDHKENDITWMSPSGFPVEQRKRKPNIVRVRTKLLGDVVTSAVAEGFLKEAQPRQHASAGAPNWIHSLDSSLLHLAFAGFDKPYTLIHDSILTTATDMDYMSGVIREQFREIYEGNPLADFAEQLGADGSSLIIGDLKVADVEQSDYFFC